MVRYRIITLIDITRSKPAREEKNQLKIGQQSNFNSFLQAIGLRSNVDRSSDPKKYQGRLPAPADGKATYWVWEFECERDEVFSKDGDPVGLLLDDLNGVPIVPDLENSTDLNPSAIQTKGQNVNTWAEML
jgi:hypothetical protein